jgi:hypothetical protein
VVHHAARPDEANFFVVSPAAAASARFAPDHVAARASEIQQMAIRPTSFIMTSWELVYK